jgi:hypothetical protein
MSKRVCPDVYNTNDVSPKFKIGTIVPGPPDSVYGAPTLFMYVQHLNAVTVVSGHCATWTTLGTKVTNDVSGGATASLGIVAGAYVNVVTENYYCFIQIGGYHPTLLGDGSVAANESIAYEATDGTWDTSTTGETQAGQCLLADTGSPATFPGMLYCPFSGGR